MTPPEDTTPAPDDHDVTRPDDEGPFRPADLAFLHPSLMRRAWLLTRQDRKRAADLVQDTFERALSGMHRLLVGSNLRSWLHALMKERHREITGKAPSRQPPRTQPGSDDHDQ